MRLDQLIQGMNIVETIGDLSTTVKAINCDSRRVRQGDIFAAVPGTNLDGHNYIPTAIEAGARGLLVSEITPHVTGNPPAVVVTDVRQAMGQMQGRLMSHPDHQLTTIAITGTNGKTTISYILESILEAAGAKPGVVGTVNYRYADIVRDAATTTPESIDLFEMMAEMVGAGVTHLIMEASSHALDQRRLAGINVNAGLFTNLSRDHLDYHKDMEQYFLAKRRLFSRILPGHWELDSPKDQQPPAAVINLDDPYGERLADELSGRVITFGINADAAKIKALDISLKMDGSGFTVKGPDFEHATHTKLLGRHNVMNVLAAWAMAWALGIPDQTIRSGVERLAVVPGRLEVVPNEQGLTVVVDYAHTPDALGHAIRACGEIAQGRVIVMFGAGGDRDRGKRPLMGKVAVSSADKILITSDNPRTEDPADIIKDILRGIDDKEVDRLDTLNGHQSGYLVEPDREKAIKLAIQAATPGDIVLIAGKGHEDYQIIGTTKHELDDRKIAAKVMNQELN